MNKTVGYVLVQGPAHEAFSSLSACGGVGLLLAVGGDVTVISAFCREKEGGREGKGEGRMEGERNGKRSTWVRARAGEYLWQDVSSFSVKVGACWHRPPRSPLPNSHMKSRTE